MSAPRIAMALKVRDEADIIESNLRFHFALGVDAFVITDNGSVDGTRDILGRWADAGLAHVWDREGSFRRDGGNWLTDMARFAAVELGADWVIHADADEFWWPLMGDLKSSLASVPGEYGTVMAARGDFVGRFGDGTFAERMLVRQARSLQRPKVAHRADPDVLVLHDGAHDVICLNGEQSPDSALRPVGRAVTRAIRPERGPESDRLIWAPVWPLRIFHFPVRSPAQFKRRVELSFLDRRVPDRGWSSQLRDAYEDGRIEDLYARVACSEDVIAAGLEAGTLVRDDRVCDLLSRCSDPLSEEPVSLSVSPKPAELEEERRAVERDVLQALSRAHRATMMRLEHTRRMAAQRHERLNALAREHRKVDRRAERRLRRIERLRAALERERSRPTARVRRAVKRVLLPLRPTRAGPATAADGVAAGSNDDRRSNGTPRGSKAIPSGTYPT